MLTREQKTAITEAVRAQLIDVLESRIMDQLAARIEAGCTTAEGKAHWEKAKQLAKKSKVKEGGDRHWRIVTSIWKKLGGNG